MTSKRLTLLIATAAALVTGGVRANSEYQLSQDKWKWHTLENYHEPQYAIPNLEARTFLFASESGCPFGASTSLVELRNLADGERTLTVALNGDIWVNCGNTMSRDVTLPSHGSARLTLTSPFSDIGNNSRYSGATITVTERTPEGTRTHEIDRDGVRGYKSSEATALISGSFSREQLAKSLAKPESPKSGSGSSGAKGSEAYDLDAVKCTLPFTEWPTDWRAYSTFDAIFLSPSDYAALPDAVKSALEGYKSLGGPLFVVLPTDQGGLAEGGDAIRERINDARDLHTCQSGSHSKYHYSADVSLSMLLEGVPLADIASVPVGTILLLLAAFCLVIIPIVIWRAIRRNRRLELFVTIPATSLAVTAIVIAAIFIAFGVTPSARVQSVTFLDQATKTATTRGAFAVFTPLDVSGAISVDADAAFRTLHRADLAVRDAVLTDRLVLGSGWVKPLTPSYFGFDKYGHCSAKLDIVAEADGSLTVANLLGAPVSRCTIRHDGRFYALTDLAPGAKTSVAPGDASMRNDPPLTYELVFGEQTQFGYSWQKLLKLVENQFRLQEESYVAVLGGCPFLTPPFGDRKIKGDSAAVVIGDFSGEVLK